MRKQSEARSILSNKRFEGPFELEESQLIKKDNSGHILGLFSNSSKVTRPKERDILILNCDTVTSLGVKLIPGKV